MISHKHKCIFIHIAKCAGTSIENAFGIKVDKFEKSDLKKLYGWDEENKIWLQHATPQQLLDKGLIKHSEWNSYYKFIVYRNSWDKAHSDYLWMKNVRNTVDTFKNYITKSGKYFKILNEDSTSFYAGDHLNLQKDYFFINGERINYDLEIDFADLKSGFKKIIADLNLSPKFFDKKKNLSKNYNKKRHYSFFYNNRNKSLVDTVYKEDIEFFKFKYDEQKSLFQRLLKF